MFFFLVISHLIGGGCPAFHKIQYVVYTDVFIEICNERKSTMEFREGDISFADALFCGTLSTPTAATNHKRVEKLICMDR